MIRFAASNTRYLQRVVAVMVVATMVVSAQPACATFHFANISEIMTAYDGNADVQFVDIIMNVGGQGFVGGSVLSAFDETGGFSGVILTVPANVSGGSLRHWIMGSAAFETASGMTADFTFTPGLPTTGGMVCWGKPFDQSNPAHYVDCIAYGTYSGPGNVHIGAPVAQPTALTAEGHSLRRTDDTNSSLNDFECANPATPRNNAGQTASLPATTACSQGTTTTTTSTTVPAGVCGDGTGDGAVTATDALLALSTSVGAAVSALCLCDVDSSGAVTATDALRILIAAVGGQADLTCAPC